MVLAIIQNMVVSSVAETEVATLNHVAQVLVPLEVEAEELGHEQPVTPLQTNNNTLYGIMYGTIKK